MIILTRFARAWRMMMKTFLTATALIVAASVAQAKTLTVYTYDSFVSDWGPGPAIEKGFEAQCGCDLEFVAMGDGAELLSRLALEGEHTRADVVLGLDTNLVAKARRSGLLGPHGLGEIAFDLPIDWNDSVFLPYDWGYFAFVYDKSRVANPPHSFEELAQSGLSVIIEDPRSSTPGLGLLLWVKAAYGDEALAMWQKLADRVLTVTPGWSEAYGLFLKGEADMVLSYTTSPAYHIIAEGDDSKAAAAFDEGHYMQVEVMARVAGTDTPELADQFMAYMLSDEAQAVLPTTNWMYPAITPKEGLPPAFETLVKPEKTLFFDSEEAEKVREVALGEWLIAMSR